MARSRRPYTQVNLLLLLLQEQGDYLASTVLETRSHRTPRETLRSLAKLEEAQVVPLLSIPLQLHPHLHVATERNDEAYSLFL